MAKAYSSLSIGRLQLPRVVLANTPWQRLRGWYGYSSSAISGVLLTDCRHIHTCALHLMLDLIWLDAKYCCMGINRGVGPWQVRKHAEACHVLELPHGALGTSCKYGSVLQGLAR